MKRFLPLLLALILALQTTACATTSAAAKAFTDVNPGDSYEEAISYCLDKGLMRGTSDTTFEPEGTLTRAMIATILHRANGEPAAASKADFEDVEQDAWYTAAVDWAAEKNIMQGYGNGRFGVTDPISQEQLDLVIRRFNGESAAWVGDPERSVPATRGQTAQTFYETLKAREAAAKPSGGGGSRPSSGGSSGGGGGSAVRPTPTPTPTPTPAPTPTPTPTPAPAEKRVLVAYFSATNTTKPLAEYASTILDAGLYEIVPETPYTAEDLNYGNSNSRTTKEQNDPSARPAIHGGVDNMEQYDTVLIGYPIWHGQAPRVISTFLESYDFSGKTVVPFCTSHSSPIGSSDTNLHALASNANWLPGRRFASGTSKETMQAWIDTLELPKQEETTVKQITLSFNGHTYPATLEDSATAAAFAQLLQSKGGSMTIHMSEYGGWEKVGSLRQTLPSNNVQTTTAPGDFVLYSGNQIVLFYGSNSWSYTRLGRLDDPSGLQDALGSGDVEITFQLAGDREDTRPFDFVSRRVTLNSGYDMPINGLGTYSLTGETCVTAVKSALDQGVRLIDTAYMYHNEAEVGRAIRESGVPREEIFVITKLYPGSQYADPEQAIQDALDKLDIGYIDMMLLHHPGENDVKAYKAMEQAVADGKIRSIGLSNWYVEELEDFLPQVTITPALVQNEIHPYYQENDVIPFIQEKGIVVQGWYPLGGRGHTAELLGDETISAIAQAHGVSSAQVILRWNLQKGVVVIPGSSNPAHIKENTELYHFELTEDEMAQINALNRGEKHDWY